MKTNESHVILRLFFRNIFEIISRFPDLGTVDCAPSGTNCQSVRLECRVVLRRILRSKPAILRSIQRNSLNFFERKERNEFTFEMSSLEPIFDHCRYMTELVDL